MLDNKSRLDAIIEKAEKYLNFAIIFSSAMTALVVIGNLIARNRLFFYLLFAGGYLLVASILLSILREKTATGILLPKSPPKRYRTLKPAARIALVLITLCGLGVVGVIAWNDYGNVLGPEVPDCCTELGLSTPHLEQVPPDDNSQIRALIENEASAAVSRDVNKAMAIYKANAVVKDASGEQWEGCSAIKDRYDEIFDIITFISLQHEVIELTITGNRATARTVLHTQYTLDPSLNTYALSMRGQDHLLPALEAEEKWTFIKDHGRWRVITFIYGLR